MRSRGKISSFRKAAPPKVENHSGERGDDRQRRQRGDLAQSSDEIEQQPADREHEPQSRRLLFQFRQHIPLQPADEQADRRDEEAEGVIRVVPGADQPLPSGEIGEHETAQQNQQERRLLKADARRGLRHAGRFQIFTRFAQVFFLSLFWGRPCYRDVVSLLINFGSKGAFFGLLFRKNATR